jgi:AraC family transcriptional regulator
MLNQIALPKNFECLVEGYAEVAGATAEVHQYHWSARQDAVVTPINAFLDLALTERTAAVGEYVRASTGQRRCGSIVFIPGGYSLHGRWEAGHQRSVCCELDQPVMIALRDRQWRPTELAASLDVRCRFIRQAMQRLAAEVHSPGFGGALLIEALCTTVAIELKRYYDHIPLRMDEGRRMSHRVLDRVTERIRTCVGSVPTIKDMAAEHRMSTRDFARLFQRAAGQSIGTYASEIKLAQAKECLSRQTLSVKEISFRCGFCRASAFSVAFRRDVGMTPGQFRQLAAS